MKAYKTNGILAVVEARHMHLDKIMQFDGNGDNGTVLWSVEASVVVNVGKIPESLNNMAEDDIDQTLIDQLDYSLLNPIPFHHYKFRFPELSVADILVATEGKKDGEILVATYQCVLDSAGGVDNIKNTIEQNFKDSDEFTTNVDSWVQLVEDRY